MDENEKKNIEEENIEKPTVIKENPPKAVLIFIFVVLILIIGITITLFFL